MGDEMIHNCGGYWVYCDGECWKCSVLKDSEPSTTSTTEETS